MGLEQAKQIAKQIDPNVDTVVEYKKYWIFFNSKIRSQDSEICIDKMSGIRVSYAELVIDNQIEETGELKQL